MANSLGTLTGALIAQEGLPLLIAQYPLIKSIVSDFSNEPVKYGQVLKTRIPSVGTVTDFSTSNGYVAQDATSTDVSVTINKHKHASFALTDQDLSGTNRNLVSEYSKSFAAALGKQIMDDIAALWILANYSNATTKATASVTIDNTFGAATTALNTRNVQTGNRFAVLSNAVAAKIRGDSNFVSQTAGGVGIQTAQFPPIHGFAVAEYSALPTTDNLTGVFGAKDAVVLASRVPDDISTYGIPVNGNISIVTHPETGLSVQVREFYDMQKGKLQVTFAIMYGLAVGNAASLQMLVSA